VTLPDPQRPLGLEARAVRLVEPDEAWPRLFDAEATRLAEALGPLARAIEHYGSTAVPGLLAKPILDLLVGTDAFGDPAPFVTRLAPIGYEYAPWAGVPGHQVYGRGQPRTHLLHLVPFGGPAWHRSLAFRDRLRADASLRDGYAALKRELAARYPTDRARYTAEKSAFIDQVVGPPAVEGR
jgi:GrpB-like predicted nucleotidyltransferase (UPF0157 family)